MPYDRLIKLGRIKPYSAGSSEISQLLKVAVRDLRASERNLDEDPDWAYSMAYNGVLQACRGLMLSEGSGLEGESNMRPWWNLSGKSWGPLMKTRSIFLTRCAGNAIESFTKSPAWYPRQRLNRPLRLRRSLLVKFPR